MQAKNQQKLWLGGYCDSTALRGLDLYALSTTRSIVALERGSMKFDAVVMSGQRFSNATNHMPIWSELAPGEHFLKFSHSSIDGPDNFWKAQLVHMRASNVF
jgi:hypothetical protein